MSDTFQEELAGMWDMLAKTPAKGLSTGKLSILIAKRNLMAAVDHMGCRQLLISSPSGTDQRGIWRSAAVTLSRVNLRGDDKARRTWLNLHCRRPELEGVFVRLAVAVADRLLGATEEQVLERAIAALDEWRDLLGSGRMSEESITGLVGELVILKRLASIDPVRAIEAWEGPRGGRHDFRRGSHAIEVKTSTQRVGTFVQIHGVQQLLEPDGGDLHLAFVRLERVPGGPLSIALLVTRLKALGLPTTELVDSLADHGVNDLASEAATMTFDLKELTWYPVGPMFPRIVPTTFAGSTVPAGVLDVAYGIDLLGNLHVADAGADTILTTFLSRPA
jgi:hypothetical protein